MNAFAEQISQLSVGHVALLLCTLLYLGWWYVFFRPDAKERNTKLHRGLGIASIACAAIAGIAAVALIVYALVAMPHGLPPLILVGVGVALYVVLLGVSYIIFDRKVTAELLLIVGWLVLEASFLNALGASRLITGASLVMLVLGLLIAFVVSFVCYMLYYALKGRRAFICGSIPLVLVALVSLAYVVFVR